MFFVALFLNVILFLVNNTEFMQIMCLMLKSSLKIDAVKNEIFKNPFGIASNISYTVKSHASYYTDRDRWPKFLGSTNILSR